MQSSTLVALLFVVVAVAHAEHAQTLLAYVPANYQGHLNAQVKNELNKFNMKDVTNLKLVATHAHTFTSFNQLKSAVQKASPQASALAQKMTQKATAHFNQLKNKLSPKSQNFFAELATLGKNFANQAKHVFDKQDASVKSNLKQVFSHVTVLANTPLGSTLIKHFEH